ncbi:hypothetical protein ACHAWF_015530 [Thalassiosira exigua]
MITYYMINWGVYSHSYPSLSVVRPPRSNGRKIQRRRVALAEATKYQPPPTTMLSRLARPASSAALRRGVRSLSTPAAPSSGLMTLNFNLPQETLYSGAEVSSVVVPGAAGEYEVTSDHVPLVAELKAGLLTVKKDGEDDAKYFVPGGFSLTHEGSATDIVCPEAVLLSDLDPSAVSSNYEAAKSKAASAEAGSPDEAEATIEVEVNKAMGAALGLSLA